MNRITQEARRRQGVVKYAEKHRKSRAARQYSVSLSSVKRWVKRYDRTWQSLRERSHRPTAIRSHTSEEEGANRQAFSTQYLNCGWDGVYAELQKEYNTPAALAGCIMR